MGNDDRQVLIVHASRFGHSTKIAQAIADTLTGQGFSCELIPLTKTTAPDPARHQAFIMVTSVRYGHYDRNSSRFVEQNRAWLDSVPNLLVTVSLTARTPAKRDPAVHVYTRKYLAKTQWTPTQTEVMPGMLDYPRYNPFDRAAIRLIMHMTGGVTDPTAVIDYTDWDEVRAAAERFADTIRQHQN